VLNSDGDGLAPGVGGTAPGRDSQACQSRGAALRRQCIKCSYARAGTGARGSVENVRVGALERSGPRLRGRSALERGGPRPRGREGLERGRPRLRERLSLERGEPHSRGVRCVALASRGGHQGRGCAVYVF
jgi:hypothetical protein